jgi:hypothetical protein
VQLLTIEGLLDGTQRAEHRDYVPNMNFTEAKKEKAARPDLFGADARLAKSE